MSLQMGICERHQITIEGTVQGVGMRPFIYRLAISHNLSGYVLNSGLGVEIEVEGPAEEVEKFTGNIKNNFPPLARITKFLSTKIPLKNDSKFAILESSADGDSGAHIPPDIAPCEDCVREILSESDRRAGYAFTNCTNCGPRYSIIRSIPYDRPATTMHEFKMCDSCLAEYNAPLDRRFHAQPNACPKCGPSVFLIKDKKEIASNTEAIATAVAQIAEGKIVAIKGIGGFHLACDATSQAAVELLRERKRRDEKPFAIMVRDLSAANELCETSECEKQLLVSLQRPIVILKKYNEINIAKNISPLNNTLGVMLPSSPLHILIINEASKRNLNALVMTSANISDEPIAFKDADAFEKLKDIADFFLTHNRDIHVRIDDSIVREMAEVPQLIRRARGFAPSPIITNKDLLSVISTGAMLKGAVCMSKDRSLFLSQHLGDLENSDAQKSMENITLHLQELFSIKPNVVACDMHPDYPSTRFAEAISDKLKLPIHRVQHHHAHIASCMAENDLLDEKVLGIAFDGTGLGSDGTVWGGEFLICTSGDFTRAAHLRPVALAGGDAAAKDARRMAISYLISAGIDPSQHLNNIDVEQIKITVQMIEKRINSPLCSSVGRLFDAVSAILGICIKNSYEGQCAISLEQMADLHVKERYDYSIKANQNEALEIDFSKMINNILSDKSSIAAKAMKFHNTIIASVIECAKQVRSDKPEIEKICLSGGSFQNRILFEGIKKGLESVNFEVYTHRLVPPNDGGIAVGQTVIASHREMQARGK